MSSLKPHLPHPQAPTLPQTLRHHHLYHHQVMLPVFSDSAGITLQITVIMTNKRMCQSIPQLSIGTHFWCLPVLSQSSVHPSPTLVCLDH